MTVDLVKARRDMLIENGYEDMIEEAIPTEADQLGDRDPLPYELFLDMGNDGNLQLTDSELRILERHGFTNLDPDGVPTEFYGHPTHWKFVSGFQDAEEGSDGLGEHAMGYDNIAVPLTDEAREWGRQNYGSWLDGEEGSP